MRMTPIFAATVATIIFSSGAWAQSATPPAQNNQTLTSPPGKMQPASPSDKTPQQSAPAEAPQVSGHDAQAGQPETGPNATKTEGKASGDFKDIHGKDKK
ncbi:hypothetical protein [Afipia carboxidovorans]|uniref:hypothetical protein n=1 Tax=Afipia carboxidovorans TaxID=40137 RepID=UPI003092819B|nr:hypothetical protein CRBSH125_04170 [Afipia carboxidovorans]